MDIYGLIPDGVYFVIGGKVGAWAWGTILFGLAVLIVGALLIGVSIGRGKGQRAGFTEGTRRGYSRGHADGWNHWPPTS